MSAETVPQIYMQSIFVTNHVENKARDTCLIKEKDHKVVYAAPFYNTNIERQL